MISQAIGGEWVSDLGQLSRLKSFADDGAFLDRFMAVKRESKSHCVTWLNKKYGLSLEPDTIFDCHIKRIHEYKRQLLNALRIVVLYNRLRMDPNLELPPRTFFFAGKAAPAYQLAKLIIKFIESLAVTIAADPAANRVDCGSYSCRTTTSRWRNG